MSTAGIEMDANPVNSKPGDYPPVAGFWPRFTAWLIDALLIFLTGQLIGLVFATPLYQIGPYGRLIGLTVILLYFGILNSSIGGGQTVGKRLLKTAARGADNRPISLWKSLLRAAILAAPVILGGWGIPLFENHAVAFIVSLAVFGLGGAILYTMLFNYLAMQGLHDLICRTYVVKPDGVMVTAFPKTARVHKVVALTWISLVAVVLFFFSLDTPGYTPKPAAAALTAVRQTLAADPRFFTVDVRDQAITPENDPAYRALVVEVWTIGQQPDDQRWETAREIAALVLKDTNGAAGFDQIQVKLTYGYDLGIGSYRSGFWYSNPVDEWTSILTGE
jgi:uncharacterized RDD family membrane protein YckC